MIRLTHIWKRFGAQPVLEDVSLDIPDGARLCLVGASGSGKSVLTKLILGLESPDQGEISIDGQPLHQLSAEAWRDQLRDFGVVFQGAALFDSLTVRENVGIRLYEARHLRPPAIRDAVVAALARVQLGPEILEKYPSGLSGGMRKRVGIARAIIHHPRYLIFDEPTTGLDPITADAIDQLIDQLATDPGRTTLVVTHDMDSVRQLATHVAMLRERTICFAGAPAAFFASPEPAIQAFLARSQRN